MSNRSCLTIILAAGEGTRMKSALPKVLHKVAGLEMLGHVIKSARSSGSDEIALVLGHGADRVSAAADSLGAGTAISTFLQEKQLGTADAVLAARPALEKKFDDILVLFGDAPLIRPQALGDMRMALAQGAQVAVMGFRTQTPHGYGRLLEDGGALVGIREEKDCSDEQRRITFCNGGAMALSGAHALELLHQIGNDNAKGEYYLTDIVAIAAAAGLDVRAVEADEEDALGVNNRAELARAETIWQNRRREELMLAGVTMLAPDSVYLAHDTEIGADAVIEPNVFFGPGVKVAEGALIRAFSHLEDAHVATGAQVGPYARLRPGAEVMENAKIGNFCEIKKSRIGEGAKVPHLSYVGDADVGAGANIGAGTITCNYDGFGKHRTEIGDNAFVGTNSSLVAPIRIGAGAYVASGSVVTQDVPDDALAFGRARQSTREGRGRQLRERLRKLAGK